MEEVVPVKTLKVIRPVEVTFEALRYEMVEEVMTALVSDRLVVVIPEPDDPLMVTRPLLILKLVVEIPEPVVETPAGEKVVT